MTSVVVLPDLLWEERAVACLTRRSSACSSLFWTMKLCHFCVCARTTEVDLRNEGTKEGLYLRDERVGVPSLFSGGRGKECLRRRRFSCPPGLLWEGTLDAVSEKTSWRMSLPLLDDETLTFPRARERQRLIFEMRVRMWTCPCSTRTSLHPRSFRRTNVQLSAKTTVLVSAGPTLGRDVRCTVLKKTSKRLSLPLSGFCLRRNSK